MGDNLGKCRQPRPPSTCSTERSAEMRHFGVVLVTALDQTSLGTPSTPVTLSRHSVSGSRRCLSLSLYTGHFHLSSIPPKLAAATTNESVVSVTIAGAHKHRKVPSTIPLINNSSLQAINPRVPEPVDPNAEKAKKMQNAITRTIWTLIMISGFVGSRGHFPAFNALIFVGRKVLCYSWVAILVFVCQTLAYRAVTALFTVRDYSLYGELIIYYFKVRCGSGVIFAA